MNDIGSRPAFAKSDVVYDPDAQTLWTDGSGGMTYRQWLIGMVAPNAMSANHAINYADDIIRLLSEESEGDSPTGGAAGNVPPPPDRIGNSRHIHVAGDQNSETCRQCGKNFRDPIHIRLSERDRQHG